MAQVPAEPAPTRVRPTPNLFSVAFGFAGLAGSWQYAHTQHWAPGWPAAVLFGLAAVSWVVVLVPWAAQFRPGRLRLSDELRHPLFGPFVSLLPIVGMLLGAAVALVHPGPGRILVDVFAVLTLVLGAWLTADWIVDECKIDDWNPGYFLPSIAGGLVAAGPLAAVGQLGLAEAAFGIGMICWLSLGSVILARLFLRPPLPAPLVPTLAIELAPPAVAANNYLIFNGGHLDLVTCALTGYVVFMVLIQVRLIRVYRQLSFSAGFWAYSFSYAAAATLALRWMSLSHLTAGRLVATVVLALITLFILALTVGTVRALAGGRFLMRIPRT